MVYSVSEKVGDGLEGNADIQNMDKMRFERVKTEDSESEWPPNEAWRIWKNVLIIGVAFMLQFTAFWGASNLQSSINADEALGTYTLSTMYGSLIVSTIFLPVIIIKWFGCKWTITLALITYIPFIAAQFHPRFYTMIPAALMGGVGAGPLWCAKCTYLTVASDAYSQVTGVASEVIVSRFFGVFFMFFQFSQVWGNLISSAVLSNGVQPTEIEVQSNLTTEIANVTNIFIENICGSNFDPNRPIDTKIINPNLAPPDPAKIQLIAGIYLACMAGAILIVAFGLDSLSRYNKGRTGSSSGLSGIKLLVVTVKQLANPYQLLILPITMFIGAEQAFLAADYTASFVSCGWGISNIGYVMICFGVCNAISALCTGGIVKITGRIPVMLFGMILHITLIVILLLWKPSVQDKHMYFIVSGAWGVCDAIWMVEVNSLISAMFPGKEEASFSSFRLYEATGSVITYAISPLMLMRTKIYLLLALLLCGMAGYAVIEILNKKSNNAILDRPTNGKFVAVNGENGSPRKSSRSAF